MEETVEKLRQSVHLLVTALVDNPSSVDIRTTEGHSLIVFEIRCPQQEMGKVVGKSGRNNRKPNKPAGYMGQRRNRRDGLG